MRGRTVKFSRIDLFIPQNVPGELDHHQLHPQTQAQVRHLVFARIARRIDFPFDATAAEASWDNDTVRPLDLMPAAPFLQLCRMHPFDLLFDAYCQGGMEERL